MQKQGFMFVYVLLYALIDLYMLCSALCVAYNANQAKHLCKGLHMLLYSALSMQTMQSKQGINIHAKAYKVIAKQYKAIHATKQKH